MGTVRQILKVKGKNIWSISSASSVFEALHLMAEKDIGALLVVDEGKPVGVFSERDYARRSVELGKFSLEFPVSEMMTEGVIFTEPERTIEECMALMTSKRIRHLPVLEKDKLIGIVTIGDVVNNMISSQITTIRELENYIAGGYTG